MLNFDLTPHGVLGFKPKNTTYRNRLNRSCGTAHMQPVDLACITELAAITDCVTRLSSVN